ncbi:MAG: hypothetical protein WCQ99_14835 [Pseudomonadota bacterium]
MADDPYAIFFPKGIYDKICNQETGIHNNQGWDQFYDLMKQ